MSLLTGSSSNIKCICNKVNNETKRSVLYKLVFQRSVYDELKDTDEVIYIGLIFHICAKDIDINTIDDNIIYSIEKLNEDFNKNNDNLYMGQNIYTEGTKYYDLYKHFISLAQTTRIQFYKAGISYSPVDIANASISNDDVLEGLDQVVKGKSPAIQPDKYLNIWITDYVPAYNIGGYAQFPWDSEKKSTTDGILIVYPVLDKKYKDRNLTAIFTHEVGHWLGLYHTFQETFNYDGGAIDYRQGNVYEEMQEMSGDCIVDTPPQKYPTNGNPFDNPGYWPSSQANGEPSKHYHMFMNFMDYTESITRSMFTTDQAKKMRIMLGLYRPGIILNSREYVGINTIKPIKPAKSNEIVEKKPEVIPENEQLEQIEAVNVEKQIIKREEINMVYDFTKECELLKDWKLVGGNNCCIKRDRQNTVLSLIKTGEAILEIDLSGLKDIHIEFNAKIVHSKVSILIQPPGAKIWYDDTIKAKHAYFNYKFDLLGPFDSIKKKDGYLDKYKIKFKISKGRMTIPTLFKSISIIGK